MSTLPFLQRASLGVSAEQGGVTGISTGRAFGCEPPGVGELLPTTVPGCWDTQPGGGYGVLQAGRGIPVTAALVPVPLVEELCGTPRDPTPVCGEVSARPPAACTGLVMREGAFPKGISHPGMKCVPQKRGCVTELCRTGGGRWTSRLPAHLGCHSGKHCCCPQRSGAACLWRRRQTLDPACSGSAA